MDEELPPLYSNEFYVSTVEKDLRGSARAQEIYKRSLLKSSNGQTLDDHDQFYRDHKLLLKLFQVLGAMPIQRGEVGRITFSWCSIPTVYAYCFYVITTVIVVFVGYERVLILTTKSKKFDEYIYSVIFVLFLVPHFWIPFTGWSVAKEVCDYKNSWGPFQLHYYKITGRGMEFPHLNTLIIIISSGCLIVAIIFLIMLCLLMEGFTFYHTSAYYHIVTTINMNCALWYINCRAIGNASQCVADSFQKDMDGHTCAYIIGHYRFLWLRLSDIVQKLGNAYARTYIAYSLFMLTNLTVAIYGFTSEIVDHGFTFTFKEVGLLVDTAYCGILLFVFCNCSHEASINISNRVQNTLMNVQLAKVDKSTAKEIELFLIAIRINSPKVTLKGYTVVNRELISSMVGTIAIYLIVLLQFKISLVRSAEITGKDFTNATFAVTIAFQPNQTCAKSQRCVLMMWRNMRDVRSALVVTNTTNSYTIEFPNHMLAATTQYIVNITAKVHQIPVDFKKETLICSNNTKLEKVTNKAHLILMGSTVSYCDSDYILNADVNYVESDYHYKWEILDNSGNLLKIDPTKGSVLRVRANSLAANTDYIVRCTAIETENGTVIDLKTKNLRILNKDLILSLAVRNISVGVNKPFTLSAYFQDDDQEETETIWTCVDQEEHPCKDFTFENSTTLSGTKLSRVGRYHITIIVKKNRIHVTDSCEVYVIANGYAQIDISSVIVPTDPSNEIVVSTYITALVTGCTLRWIPLNKTAGYIPGISGVVTNITAAEDKFLNELEESTGTTVDKEYNLVIPKPNEKWSGLKGNTCYSFRLNVTCPIQTVTKKSSEQEELIDVKYLSLTADVLIQTHKLPELNALQVSPLKGSALTTEFTFYTNATAESELTLYKFGYLLKGRVIYIANIQGDYERQSILPYIVNGVPTILQGCNRYYLCSSAAGPIVHTTFSEPTEEENRNITAKLAELMKRQDYYKAFSLAIAILETYKYAKPETFDNVKNFVGNLTTSETRRLSNLDMGDATHSIVAKEYIVEVTTLLDTKLIYDDHLLDTLLELKNKVISKKREDVEEVEVKSTIRKLLQVAQTPVRQSAKMSLEEVKSYLVISELIITSSNSTKRVNQEKQNMINQIDKYMVPLCSSLHDKQQTMVLVKCLNVIGIL
ncbi:hypothetical protein FQA39_LY04408 [Lamprigera yunnana]|nr:hypothetical protein FQA39_LY04408 [Lamprigera yunnana]